MMLIKYPTYLASLLFICFNIINCREDRNISRFPLISEPISLSDLQGIFYKSSLTLSGIGGGGGFAQIIHLSYSRLFKGISLISPTFYKCGGISPSINSWKTQCGKNYSTGPYDVKKSQDEVEALAKIGKLDPLKNLKNQKIFIYTSTNSEYSDFNLCFQTVNIYEPLLADPTQTCTRVWTGTIQNPDKRFPIIRREYEAFSCLLGSRINYPSTGLHIVQKLYRFDQQTFFEGDKNFHRFANEGYIYIPKPCLKKKVCFLNIVFHPCRNNIPLEPKFISKFITRRFAEVNHIIHIFPQIRPTPEKGGYEGCFDYFGYTGKDYATKDGVQVRIIRNMLEALLGTVL